MRKLHKFDFSTVAQLGSAHSSSIRPETVATPAKAAKPAKETASSSPPLAALAGLAQCASLKNGEDDSDAGTVRVEEKRVVCGSGTPASTSPLPTLRGGLGLSAAASPVALCTFFQGDREAVCVRCGGRWLDHYGPQPHFRPAHQLAPSWSWNPTPLSPEQLSAVGPSTDLAAELAADAQRWMRDMEQELANRDFSAVMKGERREQ